jgi:hypothetical protein
MASVPLVTPRISYLFRLADVLVTWAIARQTASTDRLQWRRLSVSSLRATSPSRWGWQRCRCRWQVQEFKIAGRVNLVMQDRHEILVEDLLLLVGRNQGLR